LAKKVIILLVIVFFSLIGPFTVATAQDSTNPLTALSSTEINFYGEEGTLPTSKKLIIVGLADGVQVTLLASDLYSNSSDESIAIEFNHTGPLPVSKNVSKTVNISLSSGAKAGIYKGSLIVIATANGNITTTNLKVVATIKPLNPWFSAVQWGLIFLIGFLIFVALIYPEDWKFYIERQRVFSKTRGRKILSKEIFVVGVGVIVAFLWLLSLVSFPFGDPSTVITTILIAPFLAYAIGIVKDRRTERLEKEKASRTLRDEGIKKDIELIANLMGEMATHCASFKPNFYEEKMDRKPDSTPRLLYQATGLLSTKVWDKSCRQGFVADIHTVHLEKYYDFIPLYNQYYTYAMALVKEGEHNVRVDKFFERFEEFREKYGALQKVLFVYLSYVLELYSKTTLAPMKLEYPRITRTLLKKLVDYRILKPFEYIDTLSGFGKQELAMELANLRKQEQSAKEMKEELSRKQESEIKSPEKKLKEELLKREGSEEKLIEEFNELFMEKMALREKFKKANPDLVKDEEEFNERFKRFVEGEIGARRAHVLEALENLVAMKFKEKIEWWHFTADDLEKIVESIYAKDVVPNFFRHVQNDFQKMYLELKKCIKDLPPVRTLYQKTLDSAC